MLSETTTLIQQTYQILRKQGDLSPHNPILIKTLDTFVNELGRVHNKGHGAHLANIHMLTQERMNLPHICGSAEGKFEAFWAEKFVQSSTLSVKDLSQFWDYKQYLTLCADEIKLLQPYLKSRRLIFLGSGPLPLSAILMAIHLPKQKIICLDYDEQAVLTSRLLVQKLGLDAQIQIIHSLAQIYTFHSNDIVVLACLLDHKAEMYQHLSQQNIETILVRDTQPAYYFWYHPSEKPLETQYKLLSSTAPSTKRWNISHLYQSVTT